jgi:hypothetical protein
MGSCKPAKDHERKKVRHKRQHALPMEKSIFQDVLVAPISTKNHKDRRWRKCIVVANNFSNFLHDFAHNFNDEDKQ